MSAEEFGTKKEIEPGALESEDSPNQVEVDNIIPEDEASLIKSIEIEGGRKKVDYFEIARKIENMPQQEAEAAWIEIGEKLKKMGVFDNLKQEGIDVFKREEDWVLPYPVDTFTREDIKEISGKELKNIGGRYKDGRVGLSEDESIPNAIKDSLAFIASGQGLGRKMDAIIHETYHGFQDLDPEEAKEMWFQVAKLKEDMEVIKLEAEIAGKPPYKAVPLYEKLSSLEEKIKKSCREHKLRQTTHEELVDKHIVDEIHAHMFSDPLRYKGDIKEYTVEGLKDAYMEMPIKRVYEKMMVKNRKEENEDEIFRYDYMKGKDMQIFVAFRQIEGLRALGLNNLEIGEIIRSDEFDKEKGYYKGLQEKMRELRGEKGISLEDHLKIIDTFELQTILRALKAKNLANDVLEKYLK